MKQVEDISADLSSSTRRWRHPELGILRFVRKDGDRATLLAESGRRLLHFSVIELRKMQELDEFGLSATSKYKPAPILALAPIAGPGMPPDDVRRARRVVYSARRGLPSSFVAPGEIGVKCEPLIKHTSAMLNDIKDAGGAMMRIQKAYGLGKTFDQQLVEQLALADNFATSRFEVLGGAQDIENPANFYRLFIQQLRLPGLVGPAIPHLLRKIEELAQQELNEQYGGRLPSKWEQAEFLWERFADITGCEPLAWVLADPEFTKKEQLLRLVSGDQRFSVAAARSAHVLGNREAQWPCFRFSTQADVACYLISGMGCLLRHLGYAGTVLCIDEGDFWQRHGLGPAASGYWNATANLACGLVWTVMAKSGKRSEDHEPEELQHSGMLSKTFPFTTIERPHLGLVLTQTPRTGPDLLAKFGAPPEVKLPAITPRDLEVYAAKFAPHYAAAYRLALPTNSELNVIARGASSDWAKEGATAMRKGVECVLNNFDRWRARKLGINVEQLWG